jgi:GNAT superfamily N-acetyltransferase
MQIRHAKPGDEAALAFLLEDNQRHYGHAVKDGDGSALAAELVDPPAGGMLCLVADDGTRLLGFALLNPYLPGAQFTRGLYLKELYITAAARSGGLGVKMIEGIRALAKERGDTRVLWTTTEDNAGAQRFYDRLGMRREKKVCYVMDVRA